MRTVAFATLGCKLNTYESHALGEAFEARAYEIVPLGSPADVVVINSCTVTARSDYKSRQLVRRVLRTTPHARVVVTGCYAEREAQAIVEIPGVYLVVGNRAKLAIPELLEGDAEGGTVLDVESEGSTFARTPLTGFGDQSRAFLKIQDGCDYRCTFCIVKSVRGASRSLDEESVTTHARALVDSGYAEISLTGVDPGAWGRDIEGRPTMARLVESLAKIDGLERIRLSSVGPQDYDDHLIELVGGHPKLARHVHIPVQSGDDRILSRMKRGSRRARIDRLVDRLYAVDSSIRVGGDFLVGFPGEDEEAFDATRRMLSEGPWSYGHVFPFSARPGTEAAAMTDQVADRTRTERAALLRFLLARKDRTYAATFVGRRIGVLIEGRGEPETRYAPGLSSHYLRVAIRGGGARAGKIAMVDVTGADGNRLIGRLAEPMETSDGTFPGNRDEAGQHPDRGHALRSGIRDLVGALPGLRQ
ncbi:MAG: tRNA (N(6)-L-threonylcarbamoyladenosine(37)-C(2))-methylthiotransferase MtaB [Gemmatimonadetes bacterium]|nr:tRNA (N(6)-L-threonylcarbamoyladenosine(37)-C(2))-methylthiotransferase MtaB [Gemmatimonadota bacterium]